MLTRNDRKKIDEELFDSKSKTIGQIKKIKYKI